MLRNRLYYTLKPLIPRRMQLAVRRQLVLRKRATCKDIWPIDEKAGTPPPGWSGWPDSKKFALVLTHDVDTAKGHDRCSQLMKIEKKLGFRSSFNFVPRRYAVSPTLRKQLANNGFEVGVHGLYHDGKYYDSREIFRERAAEINKYLSSWGSVGFRSPAMHHNLDWIHDLDIQYDASTFDTDPFEPQPDGMGTIFPFYVNGSSRKGYVELPYTLPQDFTLFSLMKEKNIDIWKRKLDWIVEKGGMALINVHPDHMNFGSSTPSSEEYPARFYGEFLEYIKEKYPDQYWHALPKEMAVFWRRQKLGYVHARQSASKRKACLLYYMKFKGSAILYREAKALREKGFDVDVICLRENRDEKIIQKHDELNLYCIQSRPQSEQKAALYFLRLITFCIKSFLFLTYMGMKKRYDIVHVTSPPDIIVFSALIPKLLGAGIILDIHDIGPELYMRKLNVAENKPIIRLLKLFERISARFADHIITVTDIWKDKLCNRLDKGTECSVLLNVPDEDLFKPFSARKQHFAESCNLFYHGSFEEHFGIDTLIKAMPAIRRQIPQVKLHLYGGGRLIDNMKKLSAELRIDDCIKFCGVVPFYELPEILKKADIGIVPTKDSVFSDEALSMKSLEYLTLGIPIVISKTTAHSYYYNDSMVTFFRPGDHDTLAKAVISLTRSNHRNDYVDHTKTFLDTHSWSRTKQIYFKVVDNLLSRDTVKST